jgi:hypothetical protein
MVLQGPKQGFQNMPVCCKFITCNNRSQVTRNDKGYFDFVKTSLVPNWLFVVLSRVTTLQGLFLITPLTKYMFQPIPQSLQCELDFLKDLEKQFMSKINYVLTVN